MLADVAAGRLRPFVFRAEQFPALRAKALGGVGGDRGDALYGVVCAAAEPVDARVGLLGEGFGAEGLLRRRLGVLHGRLSSNLANARGGSRAWAAMERQPPCPPPTAGQSFTVRVARGRCPPRSPPAASCPRHWRSPQRSPRGPGGEDRSAASPRATRASSRSRIARQRARTRRSAAPRAALAAHPRARSRRAHPPACSPDGRRTRP